VTRPEKTGTRSLAFSQWIKDNCPDSKTGYMVGNQDWVFWHYKDRKLMLCEEKTHGATVAPWFRRLMDDVINPALAEYCERNDIRYYGYHLVRFENTCPSDGWIWMDGEYYSETEFRRFLAMEDAETA